MARSAQPKKTKKSVRKDATQKRVKPTAKKNRLVRLRTLVLINLKKYLARRPHRSFQLTRRRDYVRPLELPGYFRFTLNVGQLLLKHKRLFGSLALLYALVGVIFVGFASQEAYDQLSNLLNESGGTLLAGGWGELGKAALLLTSGLSGSFAPQLNDVQQVYAAFFALLTWLTTVWLLRSLLNGNVPKLRDAIYNAGSPIVSTTIVLVVLIVQLIPIFFSAIILSIAGSTGILDNGFLSMIFWTIGGVLALISVYWASSTIIALVVVTLPGMYPWQAIQTAGDLVVGRRVRILLRIVWMLVSVVIAWILIILPAILLDRGLKSWLPFFDNVPIVPIAISLVTSAAVVWAASYVYLLYRKVVDDDASPA